MQYYIIREDLAREQGLTGFSKGNSEEGYLVNGGDLAACDLAKEQQKGRLREVTISQAKQFVKQLK
ncbi:MAG: hypothetical protein IJ155_00650 [Prevotella sp.]|nr:hypothetical protein [Prevotella sp.]